MKKFLLVLGMITCMLGLSACGGAQEAETEASITEEDAMGLVDSFAVSMSGVINSGAQADYANDEVLSAALASFEAAQADLGDYQSTDSCTYSGKDADIVITAEITGSLRKGTIELVYEEGVLTSATTNVIYSFGETMTKAGLNTLMGMGTVFSVLILIALLISCFNFIPKIQAAFSKKEKKAEAAADNAVAQIVENEAVQEEDDLELVAVIAAAIAASEGAASTDGYVVRSIRRIR